MSMYIHTEETAVLFQKRKRCEVILNKTSFRSSEKKYKGKEYVLGCLFSNCTIVPLSSVFQYSLCLQTL
jgi:hypothetical protein